MCKEGHHLIQIPDRDCLPALPQKPKHSFYMPGKDIFAERKVVFPRKASGLSGKRQKERIAMKTNNQLNVPQAREAMDKFKMQAASEEDVSSTS